MGGSASVYIIFIFTMIAEILWFNISVMIRSETRLVFGAALLIAGYVFGIGNPAETGKMVLFAVLAIGGFATVTLRYPLRKSLEEACEARRRIIPIWEDMLFSAGLVYLMTEILISLNQ